jgi:hypothetical protein
LPNSLIHLEFSTNSHYNNKLNNLPTNLNYLCFGSKYNKIFDNIPLSLKTIIIINAKQKKLLKKIPLETVIKIKNYK